MKKINFKAASESLTRTEMKSILGGSGGGSNYPDMCNSHAQCAPYGLTCQVYQGYDTNGYWIAYRCM